LAQVHEIKLRIKGIKDTKQITKAMKLISAAKLKKARKQLDQALPFFEKVRVTMVDILMHSGEINNKYFDLRDKKEGKKRAYLVITGDKGLAGGYNHNMIKLAEQHINGDREALLFVAGNVGKYYFTKNKYNVYMEFDYPVQNPTIYRAREISELILQLFADGVFDEMYLAFTNMHSTISIEPQVIKLLPLELHALKADMKIADNPDERIDDVIKYDPSPQEVLDVLVGKYVKGVIYGAFVEAFTSEQSARMTAMDSATTNADDILGKLSLSFNRARQAKITQEISEIVGGAEALK
jgi:F-type H+-transporting ATPase subunit gamma